MALKNTFLSQFAEKLFFFVLFIIFHPYILLTDEENLIQWRPFMPRESYTTQHPVLVKKVILFEFECFENLLFFAKRVFSLCQKLKIKSDLYKFHGKYIILLRSNTKHTKIILNLSSLADRTSMSALDIAITQEHAKLITESIAVDKLINAFKDRF